MIRQHYTYTRGHHLEVQPHPQLPLASNKYVQIVRNSSFISHPKYQYYRPAHIWSKLTTQCSEHINQLYWIKFLLLLLLIPQFVRQNLRQ